MSHRGLISARKKRKGDYAILAEVRDMLGADTFGEIIQELKPILKERERIKRKLDALTSEFSRKKIGNLRVIMDVKKHKSRNQGVLYFRKEHIGKKVIVWEKE